MQAELYFLRIVHIVGGIFWVGGATFMGFFVFPSVLEAGPAGGAVMGGLGKRKLMIWMPVAAITTMLAGIRLMMIVSNKFGAGYFATASGKTFAIAAGIVILAFAHGMATARPLGNKVAALGAKMAEPNADKAAIAAEMRPLQMKLAFNMKITATLLLIAAAGMALGRYM